MDELWVKFRDENGEERRIQIKKPEFVIGRHSACDLSVADSRLSRQHVRIEQIGGKCLITDLGSSNGTELNGQALDGKTQIKNGDRANLGGGLEIEFQLGDEEQFGDEDAEFNDPD